MDVFKTFRGLLAFLFFLTGLVLLLAAWWTS